MVDVSGQTDPEQLPSGRFVLIRDIRKALDGKEFMYFDPTGGKGKTVSGMNEADRNSYYVIFDRFKKFGLPHGKGWIHELPWVIDFLSFMEDTYNMIECWQIRKGGK